MLGFGQKVSRAWKDDWEHERAFRKYGCAVLAGLALGYRQARMINPGVRAVAAWEMPWVTSYLLRLNIIREDFFVLDWARLVQYPLENLAEVSYHGKRDAHTDSELPFGNRSETSTTSRADKLSYWRTANKTVHHFTYRDYDPAGDFRVKYPFAEVVSFRDFLITIPRKGE